MNTFSIDEAIKFGWNTTKANLKFLLGLLGLIVVLYIIFMLLVRVFQDVAVLSFVAVVLVWIAELVLNIGLIKIAVTLANNQKPEYSYLYSEYPKALKYLAASISSGLIVAAGFVLLIIPGIIFSIKLQMVPYLIVDKNLGPIEAIKESWKITKGVKLQLFLFGLVSIVLIILGAVALLFGLLLAIPTVSIAMAYVYKKLAK